MKILTLALATIVVASTAAAASATDPRSSNLSAMVAHLESRYAGEVTAIELDASGDKPAHYHVDMRFPQSGLATLDVDAATGEIASRDPASLAQATTTLAQAAAIVGAHLGGEVTAASLDASYGSPAHYDIDVRLPQGALARLKMDPASREIAWRTPAVVAQ